MTSRARAFLSQAPDGTGLAVRRRGVYHSRWTKLGRLVVPQGLLDALFGE